MCAYVKPFKSWDLETGVIDGFSIKGKKNQNFDLSNYFIYKPFL